MSKDFSLVAWSTNTAVEITALTPETEEFKREGWPLQTRQENDANADVESGADLCFKTPQQESINAYTAA